AAGILSRAVKVTNWTRRLEKNVSPTTKRTSARSRTSAVLTRCGQPSASLSELGRCHDAVVCGVWIPLPAEYRQPAGKAGRRFLCVSDVGNGRALAVREIAESARQPLMRNLASAVRRLHRRHCGEVGACAYEHDVACAVWSLVDHAHAVLNRLARVDDLW